MILGPQLSISANIFKVFCFYPMFNKHILTRETPGIKLLHRSQHKWKYLLEGTFLFYIDLTLLRRFCLFFFFSTYMCHPSFQKSRPIFMPAVTFTATKKEYWEETMQKHRKNYLLSNLHIWTSFVQRSLFLSLMLFRFHTMKRISQ